MVKQYVLIEHSPFDKLKLMKIYTKTGDLGETSLFGGERVKKSHPRVRTYGTLDEANSTLGLAIASFPAAPLGAEWKELNNWLTLIQEELFHVGSELASPQAPAHLTLVAEPHIARLETQIDQMETKLEPLRNFILPGGSLAGATLHLTRTMIRRAERECVDLSQIETLRPELIRYLNRLSDYLFVAARYLNKLSHAPEHQWIPKKK